MHPTPRADPRPPTYPRPAAVSPQLAPIRFTVCAEANCSTSTARTLTAILAERPSVRDFGAVGCLDVDDATGVTCPDDTAAIQFALRNASGNLVYVPTGTYRIDGTITLGPNTHLVMEGGTLLRTNHTCALSSGCNTDPVVRLLQSARLTGEGGVSTYLASPRGVINIGPPTLHTIYNCEFNHVDGIDVGGPGLKARDTQGTVLDDRWNTSSGSIGICLDSAQHFIPNGGCCYQNVVSGGHIGGVAVGVYLGCKSRIAFSALAASLT